MTYLIGQIIICLFLTAMLWGIIGWMLRGMGRAREREELAATWAARLQGMRRDRDDLQRKTDQLQSQLSLLSQSRDLVTATGADEEIEEGRAALASRDKQNAELRERVADLEMQLRESDIRVAKLSVHLKETGAENDRNKKELQARGSDLKRTLASLAEKEKELAAWTSQITRKYSDRESEPSDEQRGRIEAPLKSQIAKLRASLDERSNALAQVEASLQAANAKVAQSIPTTEQRQAIARYKKDLAGLANKVEQRDRAIAMLKAQVAAAKSAAAERKPSRPRVSVPGDDDLFDGKPDLLLAAPEGEPDDLKIINGIGPVLESTLNGLGVFHFHQLARLSPADIDWIAANINSFPDRIVRDKWVEQAAQLAKHAR